MNPRLCSDDLDNPPYPDLIQSLVRQWFQAQLHTQGLTDADYHTDIKILLLTTQSPEQTRAIGEAVLAQARVLHKTSAWVEQELTFKGMLAGADRVDFLRFELEQAQSLTDVRLEEHNERMSQFSPTRHV